jgi:prolyl-tRNA synthetase
MINEFSSFYAATDEKFNKDDFNSRVTKDNQISAKGIEVGHIFYFGDKYSKPLNCLVDYKEGKKIPVKMGSYGIGVSRLVGAIIESNFQNEVMKWPKSVSPYDVVIIVSVSKNNKQSLETASKIYGELQKQKIDVLLDDVDENMSAKFKKHDLIGIPYQIIIGSKSEENRFEFKEVGKDPTLLSVDEIKKKIKN